MMYHGIKNIKNSDTKYIGGNEKKAKIAKDVAAGAVVISCINSVVIGFFIFKDKLHTFLYEKY